MSSRKKSRADKIANPTVRKTAAKVVRRPASKVKAAPTVDPMAAITALVQQMEDARTKREQVFSGVETTMKGFIVTTRQGIQSVRLNDASLRNSVIGLTGADEFYREVSISAMATILQNYLSEIPMALSSFPEFAKFAVEAIIGEQARYDARRASDLLEYEDLPRYLTKQEVVTVSNGHMVGGIVTDIEFRNGFFGRFAMVSMEVIDVRNGQFSLSTHQARIPGFTVCRPSSLPVRLITDAERAPLTERGRAYRAVAAGAHFLSYAGVFFRESWLGREDFRADGRVMADEKTARLMDPSYFGSASKNDDDGNPVESIPTLSDADLWRCVPTLRGFSMSAKRWGEFYVDGTRPVVFREDAFDRLVMEPTKKHMIRSLVEYSGNGFKDLIDDKGGGCIFLLHGPPGSGKTLSAEAVAEVLRRPLYMVSVGELGTNPEALEKSMRKILDLAQIWNAVLLLDEADIFLEARDEKDIVRNAMVGVFLRLLEYHSGVMFLTTNRVRNFDPAMYSRISVALQYQALDKEKIQRVWTNLLSAAGITTIDPALFSAHELNGREIKNIIRIAQTMALADNRALSIGDFEAMIEHTLRFKHDVGLMRAPKNPEEPAKGNGKHLLTGEHRKSALPAV